MIGDLNDFDSTLDEILGILKERTTNSSDADRGMWLYLKTLYIYDVIRYNAFIINKEYDNEIREKFSQGQIDLIQKSLNNILRNEEFDQTLMTHMRTIFHLMGKQ